MINVGLDWNHTLIIYNTTLSYYYLFLKFINFLLVFKKVCIPASISTVSSSVINDAVDSGLKTLQKWASDVSLTWEIILATAGFALVIGFIYMFLLRYCVGCMTWGAILLYFALIGVIGWVYYKWAIDKEEFFQIQI